MLVLIVADWGLTPGDLHLQDGSQTTVERVIIKALLNAPDQAVQLLLEAEQRGEVRYCPTPPQTSSRAATTSLTAAATPLANLHP